MIIYETGFLKDLQLYIFSSSCFSLPFVLSLSCTHFIQLTHIVNVNMYVEFLEMK